MNEDYLNAISERQTEYDNELLGIKHYQIHPEMLPFVGKKYRENGKKILLVYESHYLKNTKLNEDIFKQCNWYENKLEDIPILSEEYCGVCTRWVAHRYSIGVKASWLKIFYGPFYKLANIENIPEARERCFIENFAYMNFYQRPVVGNNGSIKNAEITQNDLDIAKHTLEQVVRILKPDKIFVMSSYVRDRLEWRAEINNSKVYYMVHPSRSWWTKDNGKYGYQKFIDYYNE